METNITKFSSVEFDLEITATKDEIAPRLEKELRTYRKRVEMKGFRAGKAPLGLVKKMYGERIAYGIVEEMVQKTYESTVLDADDDKFEVLGRPTITKMEYNMDQDLNAVVRFGVRPEITLPESFKAEALKMVYTATAEDVAEHIRSERRTKAEESTKDGAATTEDTVVVELQVLDNETGEPQADTEPMKDIRYDLSDANLRAEVVKALVGKSAGETTEVTFSDDDADKVERFSVLVTEVIEATLPELDEEYIKSATGDSIDNVEDYEAKILELLQDHWDKQSKTRFEAEIVDAAVEETEFDIPESMIDILIDSMIQEEKQKNNGELPEGFNERFFRIMRRQEAEKSARWMLIRDVLVQSHEIEVSPEDLDAHFEEMLAGNDNDEINAESMMNLYKQMPGALDQLKEGLVSTRVTEALAGHFSIVEKSRDDYETAVKARVDAEKKRLAEEAQAREAKLAEDADIAEAEIVDVVEDDNSAE